MTSPKTVTPNQPQAVPDMALAETHRAVQSLGAILSTRPHSREPNLSARYLEWVQKVDNAHAAIRDALNRIPAFAARPVLPVETPAEGLREAEENARNWRKLALQFDEHRMNALSFLRFMVEDPETFKDEVKQFLAAPPLSGEKVLAERIAALASTAPAPLSGRDGSLREALAAIQGEVAGWTTASSHPDNSPQFAAGCRFAAERITAVMSAALAAVPPETAEMEGKTENIAWEAIRVQLIARAEAAEAKAERAAEDLDLAERIIGRLQGLCTNVGGWIAIGLSETASKALRAASEDGWTEMGWKPYLGKRRADRLAARASSSGEAGDE